MERDPQAATGGTALSISAANRNFTVSQKRTGPPVQPLAKSSSHQQNIASLASTVPVAVFNYAKDESLIFSSAEVSAHSPPPLALICIRLI